MTKQYKGNENKIVRVKNDIIWQEVELYAEVYDVDTQSVFDCYCDVIASGYVPFTRKFADAMCDSVHDLKYNRS